MARTIKEIKKEMTDAFMADSVIRQRYGLKGSSFEDEFSTVSVESIVFFIVASAVFVLEVFFDRFRFDVDNKISTAVLASIPWYHKICLEYQHGDELVYNDANGQFLYAEVNQAKQLVKYAACRDKGGGVLVLVSGEDEKGTPIALSNDVLVPFKSYLNKRKPAGVIVEVYSYDPDEISISLQVQYDPMLLNSDGSLIADRTVFPVEDAISGYLSGIVYGGMFNKTRLVDAVQAASGVADLLLGTVKVKADKDSGFSTVTGNNYTAAGGALKPVNLKMTVKYVLQL